MSRIEAKLSSLGVELPDPPRPVAAYVPVRVAHGLAYVSGQIPMIAGEIVAKGPVPSVVSPEDAAKAARVCAINGLAALRQKLGDLDRIKGIVRLGVFVASDSGFSGQPAVANGASEFLVEVFGNLVVQVTPPQEQLEIRPKPKAVRSNTSPIMIASIILNALLLILFAVVALG